MALRASCFGSVATQTDRETADGCADADRPSADVHTHQDVRIREAVPADREAILRLLTRLVDGDLPPWRDPTQIVAAECETLGSILATPRASASILVALDTCAMLLGCVHVASASDAHSRERHAQIVSLVVAPNARRRGVARQLIAAAECWTRARGYRLLTIQIFAKNRAADALCRSHGFVEETIIYRKSVR